MKSYFAPTTTDFSPTPDSPRWELAERGALVANDGGGKVLFKTFFRLLKGEKYLYFMFECEDDCPKAEMTGYNEPLYDEEVCELFLSPDGSAERYFEYEINVNNAVFCAHIDRKPEGNTICFEEKNPSESTVVRRGGGWTACGRIALEVVGEGDEWRFNAYRIKRDEAGGMVLFAFSPTLEPNFHRPERFGKIIFKR